MNYIGGYKIIDLADGAAVCYAKIKKNQAEGNKPLLVKSGSYTIGMTTYHIPPTFMTVNVDTENSDTFYLMCVVNGSIVGFMVDENYITPIVAMSSVYNVEGEVQAMSARVPAPPQIDGEYVLTCTVTDYEPAFTWESTTP